jgi:hypothetical protein
VRLFKNKEVNKMAKRGILTVQQDAAGREVLTSAYDDGNGNALTNVLPQGSKSVAGKTLNVTAAGTRQALANIPCREVTVIAKKTNTGSIFVGGNDVSKTVYGVELAANESFTFAVANANLLYIDALVSGEGVSYVAL